MRIRSIDVAQKMSAKPSKDVLKKGGSMGAVPLYNGAVQKKLVGTMALGVGILYSYFCVVKKIIKF